MSFVYAVLGAGRQGICAGWDLAKYEDAEEVRIGDVDLAAAEAGAARVNELVGREVARAAQVDATDRSGVASWLAGAKACFSAVPYFLNEGVHWACIDAGTSCCDLGGNTDISMKIIEELGPAAEEAGVTLVPDCGLAPGLGTVLVALALKRLSGSAKSIRLRCGGLPVKPVGPLGYKMLFAIEGLWNEYAGEATCLRNGKRVQIPTLSEPEEIEWDDQLILEGFITSGGLSTLPWTFEGDITELDYKTLRYPGHLEKIRLLLDLGLLSDDPVKVAGGEVIPHEVLDAVFQKSHTFPDVDDVVLVRVDAEGRGGRRLRIDVRVDPDPETGFTAMERATAIPASLVCHDLADGKYPPGGHPLETVVDPDDHWMRLGDHGIHIP